MLNLNWSAAFKMSAKRIVNLSYFLSGETHSQLSSYPWSKRRLLNFTENHLLVLNNWGKEHAEVYALQIASLGF